MIVAKRAQTENVAHTELCNHLLCDLGGSLDIVGRAARNVTEDYLFSGTATEKYRDLALKTALVNAVLILLRLMQGITERSACGDDRDLVNRICVGKKMRYDSVTCLVVSGVLLLAFLHNSRLLLRTCDDSDISVLDIVHTDQRLSSASCEERRLVEKVCKICAGKSGSGLCNCREVNVSLKGLVSRVYLEYLLAPLDVGIVYRDLTVKSAGAEKCGVENVGTVGCRDDDNSVVRAKSVHLNEKLVERLLTLVVSAAETCASVTSDRIDLVDEYNRSGMLSCSLKEVADTGSTNADVHLDEVRARDREEGNACFSRNCLCKQSLTRTGRADEKNTVGDLRAELCEFRGIFEEVNDFFKLSLFLVCTCNVGEENLVLVVLGHLDSCLAKGVHSARSAACGTVIRRLAHNYEEDYDYNKNENIRQERNPPGKYVVGLYIVVLDICIVFVVFRAVLNEKSEALKLVTYLFGFFLARSVVDENISVRVYLVYEHFDVVILVDYEFRHSITLEIVDDLTVGYLFSCSVFEHHRERDDHYNEENYIK